MYNGEDRVKQLNWIREVATYLTTQKATVEDYGGDANAYAEDAVAFYLEEDEIPQWWDEHDTNLLREQIVEFLSV